VSDTARIGRGTGGAVFCAATVTTAVLLAAAVGCSSSSPPSDGGPDELLSYGPQPLDGSTEAGEDGPAEGEAGPVCSIPAAAMNVTSCTPAPIDNGQCATGTFRLVCTASDPSLLAPPPASLGCQLLPNIVPTTQYYCCMCQ
jgi:hypothetical protein